MIDPETLLSQPLVTALGWALIHFIWQGTFVALLLAGVLRMLRGMSTNARYATACAALLLMLLAPLATMAIIRSSEPGKTANRLSPVSATQPESQLLAVEIEPASNLAQTANITASPRSWSSVWSVSFLSLLSWMILIWLSGVVFFSLRLIGGWLYTRRLRHYGTRSLEEQWGQALHQLCRQLRVTRPVRLLESALVKVPMVIGWLRPVILLPVGALTGLTTQQLEAIIAHELAHIRRHDYLINLLQAVVESLLFYHPAVWWVSRRIRQEREHCCDDLAVAACGDALTYARALLEMEQLRADGPQLALAANGGLLMNRIQRLVGAQPQHTNRFTGLFAGLIALTAVVSVGVGAQILLPSPNTDTVHQAVSVGTQEPAQFSANISAAARSSLAAQADSIRSVQDDRTAEALIPALQDQSWEVREAAVKTLARLNGSRAVELLIVALKDGAGQVREQAVIGLGARVEGHLTEHLIAALTDSEWQVREQAAIALGKKDDARVVEPLLKALQDSDGKVREQAAIALGKKDYARAVEPLLMVLLDSEWQVREHAARSLGAIGQARAVEPLINALRDPHEEVREGAAKSLGLIGDRRALEPLNQALQDVSEQVRKKVAEALGLLKQSGGESSMGALRNPLGEQGGIAPDQKVNQQAAAAESLRALHSSNPAERAVAACSLGRLGAVEAIPALINLLGDDAPIQPLMCWESGRWSPALHTFKQSSPGEQAAIALASLSRPAVEPLIASLNNANPSARRNAAWAIGELTGVSNSDRSAAVEPMIALLSDADPWVRTAAAFSLGELRPRAATESLIAALGDADWRVRERAAWALGEMKSRRAVESLATLLLRDDGERVRRKAAWALGEIRDSSALDALTAALSDQDQRVRATAKWAIAEIRD